MRVFMGAVSSIWSSSCATLFYRRKGCIRLGAILSALAGLFLAPWLLILNFDEVLTMLASAGADLTIVITFYGVQITICGGVEGL
jgi:cytosine/uracil/thiamine/allantoin permease